MYLYGHGIFHPVYTSRSLFFSKSVLGRDLNPFRAPGPLSILNPSNFVPKNGFPVVKGLSSSQTEETSKKDNGWCTSFVERVPDPTRGSQLISHGSVRVRVTREIRKPPDRPERFQTPPGPARPDPTRPDRRDGPLETDSTIAPPPKKKKTVDFV